MEEEVSLIKMDEYAASSSSSPTGRRTAMSSFVACDSSDINNNLLGQQVPDRNNYPSSSSSSSPCKVSSSSSSSSSSRESKDTYSHFPKKCRERLEQDCVSGSGCFSNNKVTSTSSSSSALSVNKSGRSSSLLPRTFKSPPTLLNHLLILTLLVTLSSLLREAEGVCVWQGGGAFRLACGFRQSGLFRIRSLGGLKGYLGAGFTIGDEDGFKDSLTNTDPKPHGYQRVGGPGGHHPTGQGQGLLGQYSHVTENSVPNPLSAYPSNPQGSSQQQQLLYLQQIQAEQMLEHQLLQQQANVQQNHKRQRQLDGPTPTPQDIGRGGLTKRASLWQGWPFNKRNKGPQERGGAHPGGPLRRGPPPPPNHFNRGPPPSPSQMSPQGQSSSPPGRRVQFQGYPGGRNYPSPSPTAPEFNQQQQNQQAQFNQRRGQVPSQSFDIPSAELDQQYQQFREQIPQQLLQEQTDSRAMFMNGGVGKSGVPHQMMVPPPPSPSSRAPYPGAPSPHYRQIPDLHRPSGDTSHLGRPGSTSMPHGLKLLQGTENFGSVFQLVDRTNMEHPEEGNAKGRFSPNPNKRKHSKVSPVSVSHDEDGVNINVDMHNDNDHLEDEEHNGPQLTRQGDFEEERGNEVYLSGVGALDKEALATAVYDPNIFPDIYFTSTTERGGKKKNGDGGRHNFYDNDAREDVPQEETEVGQIETAALHTNEASGGAGDAAEGGFVDSPAVQQKKQRRRRRKYKLMKKRGPLNEENGRENALEAPGNAGDDQQTQTDDDIVKALLQNRRRKKGRRRKKLFSTTPENEEIPQEETTRQSVGRDGNHQQENPPVSYTMRSREISVEQSSPRVTSLSGGGSREKQTYLSSGEKKWAGISSGEKKSYGKKSSSRSSSSGEKTFTGFPPFPNKKSTTTATTTTTTEATTTTTKAPFDMSTFGYHDALGKGPKFNFNDSPSKYNRVGEAGGTGEGETGGSGGSPTGDYDPRFPPNHEVNRGRIPNKFIRQRDPVASTTPTPFIHARKNGASSTDNSPSGSSRSDFFNRPRPTADSTKFSPATELSSSFVKFDSRESIRSIEKTKNFNEHFFSSHFNKSSPGSQPKFPENEGNGPSTFSNSGFFDFAPAGGERRNNNNHNNNEINNHRLPSPGFPQPPSQEETLLPWEKAMQSHSPSSAPTYPKTSSFSNEFNSFAFAPPVMETFGSGPSKSSPSAGENHGASASEEKSLKKNIFGGDTAEQQGNNGNWEAPNFWGSIQQVDRFGPSSDFVTNDNFKQVLDLEKFNPDSVFPPTPSGHNVDLHDRLSDYFGTTPLPAWNKPSRRRNKSRVTPTPTTPTPFVFMSSSTTSAAPSFYPPSPSAPTPRHSSEERMLNVYNHQQPGWDAGGISSFESSTFGLKMPPSPPTSFSPSFPTSFPQEVFRSSTSTHSEDPEDSFNDGESYVSSTTRAPGDIKRIRNKHGRRKKPKKPDVSIKIKGEQSAPETTGKSVVTIQPAVVLPDTQEVVDILQQDDNSRRNGILNSESEVSGGGKVNVFHFGDPGEIARSSAEDNGGNEGSPNPIMIETNPFAGSQYDEPPQHQSGFVSGAKEFSDLSQHIHRLTGSSKTNPKEDGHLQHRQNSEESRHLTMGNGHDEDFESHLPNIVPSPPDPVMNTGGMTNFKSLHSLHLPQLTPSVASFPHDDDHHGHHEEHEHHEDDHDHDGHPHHFDDHHEPFPHWGQREGGEKKKEQMIPHPIKILDIQQTQQRPPQPPTPPPTPPPYDYNKEFAHFQQSLKTPVPILKSPFDAPENKAGIKIVKQYYPPAPKKPPPPSPPPKYKPPEPSYKLPHETWGNEGLRHEENRNQFHRPQQQSTINQNYKNDHKEYVTNSGVHHNQQQSQQQQQRPSNNGNNNQFHSNQFHTTYPQSHNNGHNNNQGMKSPPQKFSPPKKYFGNELNGGSKQSKAIPMSNYGKNKNNNNNGGGGISLPHNPFISSNNQFSTINSNNQNKSPPQSSSFYPSQQSQPQQYNVNNHKQQQQQKPLPLPKPTPTKIPAQKFHPPPPPKSSSSGGGGFLSMFSNPFGGQNKPPPPPPNHQHPPPPPPPPPKQNHQQHSSSNFQQTPHHGFQSQQQLPPSKPPHPNQVNNHMNPFNTRFQPPPPPPQPPRGHPPVSQHPNNPPPPPQHSHQENPPYKVSYVDLDDPNSRASLIPPPSAPSFQRPPQPPPPQQNRPPPQAPPPPPPRNPHPLGPFPSSPQMNNPHPHSQYLPPPPPSSPQAKKDTFSEKDKVLNALETLNNVNYNVIKSVAEEQYGPTILQNLKNAQQGKAAPQAPPTTTTTPRPSLFPFLSSFTTTLAPFTSSSASGGGLSSLLNLISPQAKPPPVESNRVSPTGFNNLLSSFGGYGDSSVVSAERIPPPPPKASHPSLVSLSTDAITNLFHSLTSGEVPTKPTTTTPKPQLVSLLGPSSSEGDIKSLQAQLAKAILAKANRKKPQAQAQVPQKPNPLGLVNQLASSKNYTQAQIATLKKLIALNNIEQKLNTQLGLEQTTKGSVLKLGAPKSPSIFSSLLSPSGPTAASPSSLFSNKMLLSDRVNQVQNSLFHPTNHNDPTLLALKALALNKAQSIRHGSNNNNKQGDFQPIPVDLSAILSPSPPPANPKGTKRLVDVRNAPKSFYPANATMGFDASSVPLTSDFTCQGQQYFPGLYADTNLGCKVFHLCAKTDAGYLMKSFRCPKETVFDQEVLKCNWNLYVDCSGSEQKYHFNKYLSQSFQFLKVLGEFSAGYQPKNSTYSTLPEGM